MLISSFKLMRSMRLFPKSWKNFYAEAEADIAAVGDYLSGDCQAGTCGREECFSI